MNTAVGSRRSNASRHVAPKSAIIQHAVHPPERNTKRHASSAASQRFPIQPPVCKVQPGRALELRTNLGLIRAKQMLEQQHHIDSMAEPILNTTTVKRAQLKTARLQPLGIVDDESIASNLCLGIIPASPRRQHRHQRPRSSTAPGVHFDLPDDPTSGWGGRRVKRSHSAILARTVNTEHLMKLLSVSKQTGLVPQEEAGEPIVYERNDQLKNPAIMSTIIATEESSCSPGKQAKVLPPVVQSEELVMKIEVKGLQKHDEVRNDGVSQAVTERQGVGVSKPQSFNKHSPRQATLPPLSKGISVTTKKKSSSLEPKQNVKTSNLASNSEVKQEVENSIERGHKHSLGDNNTTDKNTSPSRVRVVSIGERQTHHERPRSKTTKQRRSSGRLSLGWSSPQPVGPITGSPLSIPTREPTSVSRKGNKGQEKESNQELLYLESRPLSSSMRINVNVNEFLEDSVETMS